MKHSTIISILFINTVISFPLDPPYHPCENGKPAFCCQTGISGDLTAEGCEGLANGKSLGWYLNMSCINNEYNTLAPSSALEFNSTCSASGRVPQCCLFSPVCLPISMLLGYLRSSNQPQPHSLLLTLIRRAKYFGKGEGIFILDAPWRIYQD